MVIEPVKSDEAILIVDDVELNRAILSELFQKEYSILEAENGAEALELIEQNGGRIKVMLLDLVMPEMDGFQVLSQLRNSRWFQQIPIVLITAENSESTALKGYTSGVSDIINKPFNPEIVHRRVENIIELYNHKRFLETKLQEQYRLLEKQAEKLKKANTFVIDTLSTAVEFRSSESGFHIARMRKITEFLLRALSARHEQYDFSEEEISMISDAAALHDIGKIAIPDEVLLKPGRLTPEEFEIMKTHTTKGCEILESLNYAQDEEYYRYSYEICRHHHEQYDFSEEEISMISDAAALHDIGKIAIPDEVLLKPGRLTPEEFEIMKTHTTKGCEILESLNYAQDEEYYRYSYEICRHHHERWDGKGYPDGLKGNQIPIWAQVVALADVYEALTGERVYKPVYSHEKALSMIVNGECGQFNPELLNCFLEEIDNLLMELRQPEKQLAPPSLPVSSKPAASQSETLSERTLRLLELERQKYRVLSDLSGDITFDYDAQTDLLTFSEKYTEMFGGSFQMQDALKVIENTDKILKEDKPIIWKVLKELTPEQPVGKMELRMQTLAGDFEWFEVLINALWRNEKEPECVSLIGKMTNINDQKLETSRLKRQASTDSLTGTYNRKAAVELISDYLLSEPMPQGALFFMDIDDFKSFNDDYGHQYGDKILQKIGEKLRGAFRGTDIVGRIGGDEFIVFLEEISSREAIIRKAREVCGMFRKVGDEIGSPREITGSVGVACSPDDGLSFDSLLAKADQALYHAKKCGKNQFSFSTDLSKQ